VTRWLQVWNVSICWFSSVVRFVKLRPFIRHRFKKRSSNLVLIWDWLILLLKSSAALWREIQLAGRDAFFLDDLKILLFFYARTLSIGISSRNPHSLRPHCRWRVRSWWVIEFSHALRISFETRRERFLEQLARKIPLRRAAFRNAIQLALRCSMRSENSRLWSWIVASRERRSFRSVYLGVMHSRESSPFSLDDAGTRGESTVGGCVDSGCTRLRGILEFVCNAVSNLRKTTSRGRLRNATWKRG